MDLPITALAPMQDVTSLGFMQVIASYGSPDYWFTEYFRVYADSRLEGEILRSITENTTGKPIFAQMIGESIPDLIRTAKELAKYAIAGIDLNLGCPAPRVYRKNVGGGLLRDPARVGQILAALRSEIPGKFSVKMRLGFDHTESFLRILELINLYQVDLVSLHGRTVKGGYHSEVRYDLIAIAVNNLNCPVLANGNITSAAVARSVLNHTQAAGVMIGRSAIRNPWIFRQMGSEPGAEIRLGDVYEYIARLVAQVCPKQLQGRSKVNYLKKYLNFIGQSVDPQGQFLRQMRLAQTELELWRVCDRFLAQQADQLYSLEPYAGLVARPSCEVS
ncbi:MAG: tRNA-dihydrouridine synthase family protein [Pseudanabaenaceae cyanobacterium bins.68]|nr:tRNA-dihydrouridine synthase family protein [Pseudanabaenaceae cyanobacterium bins.68]